MRSEVLILLLLAGCGRINFDARQDGAGAVDAAPIPNLLVWLELEDPGGVTFVDSSGHGHSATCGVTCPTVEPGIRGASAARFNGVDSSLIIAFAPDLDPKHISVSAWVKKHANDVPGSGDALVGRQFGSGMRDAWSLGYNISGPDYEYLFVASTAGTGAGQAYAGGLASATDLERWVHLVGIYDGQDVRLYVDGALVGTTPAGGDIVVDTTRIVIGCADNGFATPNECTDATIDDLRIYDVVLTDQEIQAL